MNTNQPTTGGALVPSLIPLEETMVKFTNKDNKPIWFNVLRIESIQETKQGCFIKTVSNRFHVLESMDEVIKIIEDKMLQLVGGVK